MDDCKETSRREFLSGVKGWSGAVTLVALGGGIAAMATTAAAWVNGARSGWVNRYGGRGAAWANRGSVWANRGVAWVNGRAWVNGVGGWVNRGGGSAGWVNRGGGSAGWANRGGGGAGWVNRYGGAKRSAWVNRR